MANYWNECLERAIIRIMNKYENDPDFADLCDYYGCDVGDVAFYAACDWYRDKYEEYLIDNDFDQLDWMIDHNKPCGDYYSVISDYRDGATVADMNDIAATNEYLRHYDIL